MNFLFYKSFGIFTFCIVFIKFALMGAYRTKEYGCFSNSNIANPYRIVYTEITYSNIIMYYIFGIMCKKRKEWRIMKKFVKKMSTMLLSTVLTAGLLTGCGGASSTSDTAAVSTNAAPSYAQQEKAEYGAGIAQDNYTMDEAAAAEEVDYGESSAKEDNTTQNMDSMTLLEEKLVYHCNLALETLDYAGTMKSIKEAIAQYGGVIQSENETDSSYEWYYADYQKTQGTMRNYIEIRVPSKNYDSFVSALDGVGKITSKSSSIDNISQQYYDTTTQIDALKIQEKNLLEMMEQCDTIEDMLTVQERLTTVQYELNRLQTSKRYMDVDVAYSYVNISIEEVMEFRVEEEPVKKNTFADRLVNTIKSTGSGYLMFLEIVLFLFIRLFPYLVIIGIILFFALRKTIKRNKEEKKYRKAQQDISRNALRDEAQNADNAQNNQNNQ